MKQEKLTHLRWSDFPKKSWLGVVLIKPREYGAISIRNVGTFIMYKAYFSFMKEKRVFNLVLPYKKFNIALKAIPPELRDDFDNPVSFEIYKSDKGKIYLKNWKKILEGDR